jgi:GTP-binding protein YchF
MVSWLCPEMELGIVGLPKSGKTTLFNSLTKGRAEIHAFGPTALEPNIGVAKVPDSRLDGLQAILNPKRIVPAEVKYVDVAITRENRDDLGSDLRGYLRTVDAFIHVVRDFTDETIPHIKGSVDPVRDISALNIELALSDLAILERRLTRINDSLKGAKQQERDGLLREQALLSRIKPALENEIPIREQSITKEEARILENYQFLTSKPILVLLNIGEAKLPQAASLEEELRPRYPQLKVAAVCAKLEMELTQLSDADAAEFRAALGMVEGVIDRIIRLSYEVLGLLSFFSIASGEIRAWTVTKGTPAHKAAGVIHSDMERGFIRAEVISYSDLVTSGSLREARNKGHLRLEGKNYTVQDGDVITFLFSV